MGMHNLFFLTALESSLALGMITPYTTTRMRKPDPSSKKLK